MDLKKADLIIFSFLSILFEFLSSYFFNFLNSGFILSFSLLIFLIMALRWGIMGIVPFLLSALPLIAMEKSMELWQSILYYLVANVFAVIPIGCYTLFCKGKSRNVMIQSPVYLILFSLATFLSLAIGKWIACIIINQDVASIGGYFISMIFTYILTILVLYALSRLKNSIVADMDSYRNDGEEV